MKKYFFSLLLGVFAISSLQSQIKIGNNPQNIDASSVLELESNSRVLVITRINDAQMNAITPLEGALVYNIDEECVFYYNGTSWANLCEEGVFNTDFEVVGEELVLTDSQGDSVTVPLSDLGVYTFTSDPVFNPVDNDNTIVITQTADNVNLEVGEITGFNIVDGTINGFLDIQGGSITGDKIQEDEITAFLLNPNVAGVGLTQAPDGSLDVDVTQITGTGTLSSAGTITITGDPANALFNNVGLEVADNAITNIKMADNSVGTAELINDAVTTDKILDASITNGKLDKPTIPISGFAPAVTEVDFGNNLLRGVVDPSLPTDAANMNYVDNAVGGLATLADGTIYIGDATSNAQELAISGDATMDNAGVLTIEPDAVGTTEIIDGEINTADIAADAIDNTKIADNAINTENIADGQVQTADILDDNVTPAKIQEGTANEVLRTNAAGTDVEWGVIDANSIAGQDLTATDGSITVATGTGATLVASSISVTADGITNDKIADNAINTENITDGEINTADIATDAIDNTKIADDAINTENIADGQVQTIDIANANVTPAKLADGTAVGQVLQWNGTDWVLVDDSALAITEADGIIGNEVTDATAGGSLTRSGTGATATPFTLDVTDGGIGTAELAADAVDNTKIADDAVQVENILNGNTNQVLVTNAAGTDVEWTDRSNITTTGTAAGSIFFAAPTTFEPVEDNAQLFWDDTNNVLGIGTNTPDISGNIRIQVSGSTRTGGLINSDGSATTPSYRFNSDPNTGMFWGGAADELAFSVGGVEALRIRDEGTTDSELVVNGSLELTEQLIDETGATGNTGDILTATATGVEWKEPAVVAMGKYNPSAADNLQNATVTGAAGNYQVTLTTPIASADYIIQLTVESTYTINFANQTANTFDVIITKTDGTALGSPLPQWFFTVSDF
jgi:hypothetical protein